MSILEGSSLHPAPSLIFSAHGTRGLTSGLENRIAKALFLTQEEISGAAYGDLEALHLHRHLHSLGKCAGATMAEKVKAIGTYFPSGDPSLPNVGQGRGLT